MKTYEFDMVLKGIVEITDTQADAIRSASIQVQSAGFLVAKVELDANSAVSLEV